MDEKVTRFRADGVQGLGPAVSVRAVKSGGEPLFCALDIAHATEHAKWDSAMRGRCEEPARYVGHGAGKMRYLGIADAFRVIAWQRSPRAAALGAWLLGTVAPQMLAEPDKREMCKEAPAPARSEEDSRTVELARRVLASASDDAARARTERERAARSLLAKMRNEAAKIGNSVRANALADAMAVIEEVA